MAPLALASIIQAVLNFRAYRHETDRILVQTALYAAYSEQNIFARTEQLLRSLARRPALTANNANCHQALSDALVGAMPIVNFTRVDATGTVICMGTTAPKRSYAKLPWWPKVRNGNNIVVGNEFRSSLVNRKVLPVALPVRDKSGRFTGALSASVDLHWLETAPQVTKLPAGALSMIVDSSGHVLASNRPAVDDLSRIVASRAKTARRHVFSVDTRAGQRWRWVAEPIGVSDKYVAFGIPAPHLLGTFRGYLLADVVLMLLIVAATCAAIWLGTEWLVVRWTLYLKRVAEAFGRNRFELPLSEMRGAPEEFQQLGRQMKRMASAIRERDHNLSQALEHQLALTREIHHRVKNNLQIVSSLIFINTQNITDPKARRAFRKIATRMDALTLIQRLIERTDTNPTIDIQALFERLADQIRALASENAQAYELTLSVGHAWMPPDTATPIVLFAIEALTHDMPAAHTPRGRRRAHLELKHGDHFCTLVVEDGPVSALPANGSLPDRIMRSLAEQLRAHYAIESTSNSGTRISLRIPLHADAEPDEDLPPPRDLLAFGAPVDIRSGYPQAQSF